MEGTQQEHWSKQNLGFAIEKLQQEPPTFGDNGNTYERYGKYYVMGYEVEKPEYDQFYQRLSQLFTIAIQQQKDQLGEAA